MARDSIFGTILVALGVCVVCSVLVSTAAVKLNERQENNKRLYQMTNILRAAGLVEKSGAAPTADEVSGIFDKRVTKLLVDLDEARIVPNDEVAYDDYNPRDAANDSEKSKPIGKVESSPGIKRRALKQFVYQVHAEGDENKVEQYVLPVSGKGLWSTLYGFVSVDADGKTVRGITFYEHGETPGLGGEVENVGWQEKWEGKLAYDSQGEVAIKVLKGSVDASSPSAVSDIDGLSGATITSKGVSNFVRYWLGPNGFGPFLKKQIAG